MTNQEDLQDRYRLVTLLLGIVNRCEVCTSKLKNGFVNLKDYCETEKMIERLDAEIRTVGSEIADKLE